MNTEEILQLFKQDKLLVRAMSMPHLNRNIDVGFFLDFTFWAKEIIFAKNADLTCASSTLLVSGENIPTYKNMGFMINSDKVEIVHVCDIDSGSSGNIDAGTFFAAQTNLKTLPELAKKTRREKRKEINEVNINIRNTDAFVGLFLSVGREGISQMPPFYVAQFLLAQEYYKMHTGIELPLFEYNAATSKLTPLKISEEEKKQILSQGKSILRTLTIGYDADPFNIQNEDIDFRFKTFDNDIKTEKENTNNSTQNNLQITKKRIEKLIDR